MLARAGSPKRGGDAGDVWAIFHSGHDSRLPELTVRSASYHARLVDWQKGDKGDVPMIACFIRYEIEPYDHAKFETYSLGWKGAITRSGATPIGYFAPHEGSLTTAY